MAPTVKIDLEVSGFFSLRSPLLPFEQLEVLGASSEESEGLRQRLLDAFRQPVLREALFVASPHLLESLQRHSSLPSSSKRERRSEHALMRYFTRMAMRPTPFGLFAGCTLGRIAKETRLELDPLDSYVRQTRIDTDYLLALSETLGRDGEVRNALRYRPNTTLYSAAGRWLYYQVRFEKRTPSYHLIAVETDEYLEATLGRAESGATLSELVRALVEEGSEDGITTDDASVYVNELISSQVLVSSLAPNVTGPETIDPLIARCETAAPAVWDCLTRARSSLARLDGVGLGAEPERYRETAEILAELPVEADLPRLFQVDLLKPAKVSLSASVVAELKRGIALLHQVSGPLPTGGPLQAFRDAFRQRYGEATVRLTEALDSETGIGFGARGVGSEGSPLLDTLAFPPRVAPDQVQWRPWNSTLLSKIEALDLGPSPDGPIPTIEIAASDLEATREERLPPLPDAMFVMATLAASSEQAIDRGDFQLLMFAAGGPSGAPLLGRFCRADPELAQWVEEHLRAEEALEPEAVFAEIVHLPGGRIGNVTARPRLRDYEIPFLGLGAAPTEYQIPVNDLVIRLRGERFELRSRRLGRRVIPRLTNAHFFSSGRNVAMYRFLASLQFDGIRGGLLWDWEVLDRFSFLPRVESGRLVLARARWRVLGAEITELCRRQGSDRERAVADWRVSRGLPKHVVLADLDHELLVDLENPLSVDAFLDLVRQREKATLLEFFPGPDQLCVRGREGRFTHELVVPMVRKSPREVRKPTETESPPAEIARNFPPGSEWLYLKLYTGKSNADRLLSELGRLLPRLEESFDQWFFIRYGDPDWHLRLRFQGEPQKLHGVVLPALQEAAARYLEAGWLHRVQLDTYVREIERYGGEHGVALSERLARVDSDAVLAIVGLLDGDEGAEARWQLALRGSALLLADCGLGTDARLEVARAMQSQFAFEHGFDARIRKQLSARLRRDRRKLEQLLAPEWSEQHPFSPGFEILAERSRRLVPIVEELKQCSYEGRLNQPIEALVPSYIHMFNNRLLRSQSRAHEAVLYDFLFRQLVSQSKRRSGRDGRTHDG